MEGSEDRLGHGDGDGVADCVFDGVVGPEGGVAGRGGGGGGVVASTSFGLCLLFILLVLLLLCLFTFSMGFLHVHTLLIACFA